MKTCANCKNTFPAWKRIDGKQRNLSNRKFCLECSPYKSHNTRSDLSKPPTGRNTVARKIASRTNNYKRAWKRKADLIEMSGGCCQRCGYKKCQRALSFHHRNPLEKSFGLTLDKMWSQAWDSILLEWEKCDLLCLNCHAEAEEEIAYKRDTRYQREKKKWTEAELKTNNN